jgi:putative transcriptional regulator
MIRHHPDDSLLLSLASGMIDGGTGVVVAAHVERCAHCQGRVRDLEAVGGALLETVEPALLAPQALASTLERIDAPATAPSPRGLLPAPPAGAAVARAQLPGGLPWPHSMRSCSISRWHWLGPGMRWSRVRLAHDRTANVFLLRIAAGKCLPQHTHSDRELTQVLYGAFHDGRALFGPGDFDEADASVLHRPVVQPGSECVCIASVKGKVLFEGAIARTLGALVGM